MDIFEPTKFKMSFSLFLTFLCAMAIAKELGGGYANTFETSVLVGIRKVLTLLPYWVAQRIEEYKIITYGFLQLLYNYIFVCLLVWSVEKIFAKNKVFE